MRGRPAAPAEEVGSVSRGPTAISSEPTAKEDTMLVFISDIHLTDGTSGETIEPGAFKKFADALEDMAASAEAKKIEVVLLGDILDVIRSDYWLNSDIRPWSDIGDRDGDGNGLKEYAGEIVERICDNAKNKESMDFLAGFKEKMKAKGVEVSFTYFTGNHDWLINRYPGTRRRVAEFLGMDDPGRYENVPFRTEGFWGDYRVFARHGDIYDPFNFDGARDASSLGDAIVIDLINRFPKAVENDIGVNTDHGLIKRLKEIDNVRPLVDIPLWVRGVCRRAKSVEIGDRVKEVWNDLVERFLAMDFVRTHDRPWRLDIVDALQFGLGISKYLSFRELSNLPLRKFQKTEDYYVDRAFNEEHVKRNEAEFVLYGHTHGYKIQPLDIVPLGEDTLQKTYFNTGTWRKVHRRTAFDFENQEFSSWHVMTFIAFYLDDERGERRFEVWNGALG